MKNVLCLFLASVAFVCFFGCAHTKSTTSVVSGDDVPFARVVANPADSSGIALANYISNAISVHGWKVSEQVANYFGEVEGKSFDYRVTLVIFKGEAIIVVGEHSPSKHVILGNNLAYVLGEKGVKCVAKLSTEVNTKKLSANFPLK